MSVEDRIEAYKKAKEQYSTKLEEIQRELYITEEELKKVTAELNEQFGTTDIDVIEQELQKREEHIKSLEEQLQNLNKENTNV